jgi:hypothetical protein
MIILGHYAKVHIRFDLLMNLETKVIYITDDLIKSAASVVRP